LNALDFFSELFVVARGADVEDILAKFDHVYSAIVNNLKRESLDRVNINGVKRLNS
jgi:hypothetical protein